MNKELEELERRTDLWIKAADAAKVFPFSESKIREQAIADLDAGREPGVLSMGFRCIVCGNGVRVNRQMFVDAMKGTQTYADTEEQNEV